MNIQPSLLHAMLEDAAAADIAKVIRGEIKGGTRLQPTKRLALKIALTLLPDKVAPKDLSYAIELMDELRLRISRVRRS